MKKVKLLLVLALSAICISGCGKIKEIKSADLALKLNSEVSFAEQLAETDETTAKGRYGLDTKDCESIISFIGTKGTCDEFAIIKTADKKGVEEKLQKYLAKKKTQYETYRPEEASKLSDVVIEEYKDCVTMIVTSDKQNALSVYKGYLKK